MYRWQVLILVALTGVISPVVAHADPFQTDQVWDNWIALAVTSAIGVIASVVVAVVLDIVGWVNGGYDLIGQGLGGLFAAMIGLMVAMTWAVNADSGDARLIWSSFGLAAVGYTASGLAGNLAER